MGNGVADSHTGALARLAQSRAEIKHILEPPRREHRREHAGQGTADGDADDRHAENFSTFPRSRTMRMLMTGRGLGTAGAVVGGLFLARPALALRLLRMIPAGTVARMLLVKAFTLLRAR